MAPLVLIFLVSLASVTCRADSDFEMGLPGHIIRIAVQSESRVSGLKLPSNEEIADLARSILAEELIDADPTKKQPQPTITVRATRGAVLERAEDTQTVIMRIAVQPLVRREGEGSDSTTSLAIVSLSDTVGNVWGDLSLMEGKVANASPPSSFVVPVNQMEFRRMLEGAIRERLDAVSRRFRVKPY